MKILVENITNIKITGNYSDVIPKPDIRKPLQRDEGKTIEAIEDQEFLSKLQIQLNKVASPSVKPVTIAFNICEIMIKLYINFNELFNKEEMVIQPNSSPTTPKTTTLKTPSKSAAGAPDSTNLKSFFQNLLAKNAPNANTVANNVLQTSNSTSVNNNGTNSSNDQHSKCVKDKFAFIIVSFS